MIMIPESKDATSTDIAGIHYVYCISFDFVTDFSRSMSNLQLKEAAFIESVHEV